MKIEGVPFEFPDWNSIPETAHPGASGIAHWRTIERGNVRVRFVSYSRLSRGHWCSRGHVILVLDGVLGHGDSRRPVSTRSQPA